MTPFWEAVFASGGLTVPNGAFADLSLIKSSRKPVEEDRMGALKVEAKWFLFGLPTIGIMKAVTPSNLPFACHT